MSLKVAVKLAALLSALIFTIAAIIMLKQGHMESFWTSLGFSTGERLNWCSERVQSVYHFDSGSKLLEKDGKWIWQDNSQAEQVLEYLQVEKWFARYCQVPFENVPSTEDQDIIAPKALLEVVFVGGDRLTIFKTYTGGASFLIRKHEFQSETLRKGLKELLAFGGEIQ